MTDREIEELMNAVLDGTAPAADMARLDSMLADDPTLLGRFDRLQQVHELLTSAPREAAPSDLAGAIMARIRVPAHRAPAHEDWLSKLRGALRRDSPVDGRGTNVLEGARRAAPRPLVPGWALPGALMMAGGHDMKKVLFGVGVLALGAVVYFGLKGDPTRTAGIEGTIGVANRYQENQITNDDVVLGDESINDILQTELFHEVVTNPDFRKLVTSDAFQKVVGSDAFKGYIANPEVQKAYAAIEASRGVSRADNGKSALADDAVQKLLSSSPEFQRLTSTREFGRLFGSPILLGKLTSADGARGFLMAKGVVEDADLARQLASDPELGKFVASVDFQKLVAEEADALGKIAKDGDFARLLARPEVGRLFGSTEFSKLVAVSPEAGRTLLSPELGRLVTSSDGFRNAFLNADYGKIVSRPEFQKAVALSDSERLIRQ